MAAETLPTFRRNELPSAEFIFGSSPGMRQIRTTIERASQDDLPVLIEGESGTGKELVARFLHNQSVRLEGPFVKVNCGALPARLLEAEMFGYERNAVGDVRETTNGSIGMARAGTLFLDEIRDLELTVQEKLLRAFETGRYGRQDGSEQLAVDARFVCASTRELRGGVCGGSFPEELLRCFGHHVRLQPLRERKQDIPQLCEYLVEKFARNFGRPVPRLSPFVMKAFQQWNWPGNIRELENWIARIVIFGTEEAIGLEFRRHLGLMGVAWPRKHRNIPVKAGRSRRMRGHR